MAQWLRHPSAMELLAELQRAQQGSLNALLLADTEDAATISALRVIQGASHVIGHLEARIESARKEKEESDER